MKKSGYHTTFHIYIIFAFAMLITMLIVFIFSTSLMQIQTTDGSTLRSDYPKQFTQTFQKQIVFLEDSIQLTQKGMESLQKYNIGFQLLNTDGQELFHYQKPDDTPSTYTNTELLQLQQKGYLHTKDITSFIQTLTYNHKEYIYILHFPIHITKVTMYLNGDNFTEGKTIFLFLTSLLFVFILLSGIIYGLWTTHTMHKLSLAIKQIAARTYTPMHHKGSFRNIYESLDSLHTEIRESDHIREQSDRMREEWIANITHDLKTPLSPIKGYAEILTEQDSYTDEQIKKYAYIMLKNISFMETLINDLKLTYQLDNHMIPMHIETIDMIRFLKEMTINILNTPEYEQRQIHFHHTAQNVMYACDPTLLTRALQNIIINAFVHGSSDTEVYLHVEVRDTLQINITDTGQGMSIKEIDSLFQRYYRGTDTIKKTEGTGLGLAIAKSIIELHNGTIHVTSTLGEGTTFTIDFPLS